MRVDFPTLGMPTTMTRRGRFMPRAASRASFSAQAALAAAEKPEIPFFVLQSVAMTVIPLFFKKAIHFWVALGSARSIRFKTRIRGFPPHRRSISGFRLEIGIRASTISHTASTCFRSASIWRRVLVIWPGYHWIFIFFSSLMRFSLLC